MCVFRWRNPHLEQITVCRYPYIYIIFVYIYSHPEVDRILFFFKKDFLKIKKIVGIFSKPSVFTRFSSLLSHF